MATINQTLFVCDIEAACKHLIQSGSTPASILTVMEASGRHMSDLRPIVHRLVNSHDLELIERLREAFKGASQIPKCISVAISKLTPNTGSYLDDMEELLKTETVEELTEKLNLEEEEMPSIANSSAEQAGSPSGLTDVIQLLSNMSPRARKRVLNAAMAYFEVGE